MSYELAYFLKVNVAIVLFYAFYRLFFYKDTFFKWRRTALLSFFTISLLYPLLNIQEWVKAQEPVVAMLEFYAMLPEITVGAATTSEATWKALIASSIHYVYIGIALLLFIRFLIQLFGIIKLSIQTKKSNLQGTKVHLLPKPAGPFSFFKWIFIYPDAHSKEEIKEILTHEQTHVQQWHSIDVLVSELICIICWFNPFAWLIKREVRNNLEFLADHKVLEVGYDCKTYQYHLLGLAHQKPVATLYNSFNVLPLKIRIRMMNKKRTKQIGRTKYLIFLPLAALLLVISNIEAIARSTEQFMEQVTQPEMIPDHQTPIKTGEDEEPIFEIVEQMPEFPGGNKALMEYLSTHVQYPQEAKDKDIQGRVIVQYIVDKEGNIKDPIIKRSASPELDEEALRVVSGMPKWIPGKQRGQAVNVRYTMPVMFRLSDKVDMTQKTEVEAIGLE